MPYTQADIDNLKAIRASGASEVQFSDGRRVRYVSPADLDAVIAAAEAEVSPSTAGRATFASFRSD